MTVGRKKLLLVVLWMAGGVAILGLLALQHISKEAAMVSLLGWFLLFATLQWAVLRCPRCGVSVFYVRKRVYTGFVADRCRKCGYTW
jgi:predicted nucleic-acid-binding Zn-ribbon protein